MQVEIAVCKYKDDIQITFLLFEGYIIVGNKMEEPWARNPKPNTCLRLAPARPSPARADNSTPTGGPPPSPPTLLRLPLAGARAMGGDPPALKRPKLEKDDSAYSHHRASSHANGAGPRPHSSASASTSSAASDAPPPEDEEDAAEDMSEEAALALIAHRERVVQQCNLKLAQYQSQVPLPPPAPSPRSPPPFLVGR